MLSELLAEVEAEADLQSLEVLRVWLENKEAKTKREQCPRRLHRIAYVAEKLFLRKREKRLSQLEGRLFGFPLLNTERAIVFEYRWRFYHSPCTCGQCPPLPNRSISSVDWKPLLM